ncbi:MAG TPA: ABC-type transport auxiliary lipoprotein family protein [Ramlibacter sp.]|uniref:ABC-type transport auxiliary lipoprotein family protein n=1 Tax=Ramlibacter sp. TaxID=1917967 RepID=UPI002ED637E7
MRVTRRVPLLGGLCLAGCAALAPVDVEVTTAVLDRVPADVPRAPRRPETLLVYPLEAADRIDTRRMAYTLRPHHFAYYARNEWAESPARMLQPLLVRTLEATGRFATVVTPPASGAHYGLRADLEELVQDFGQVPPVLHLSLRLRLVDERSNRTLAVRELEVREPLQQQTPYAGVVAANAALDRALRDAAVFVLEAARRTP